MISCEYDQYISFAGAHFCCCQQDTNLVVNRQHHVAHLRRVGTGGMADIIHCRKTHRQHIGLRIRTQILGGHQGKCKIQHQLIRER